jgi:CrcB protein
MPHAPKSPASRPPARNILLVAAGGAIGAVLRYLFILIFPVTPGAFPLMIFFENITGAFLLGLIMTLVLEHPGWRWEVGPFLTTGVLGSFTTFSNVTLDLALLSAGGNALLAAIYAGASVLVGLAAALMGMWIARHYSGSTA